MQESLPESPLPRPLPLLLTGPSWPSLNFDKEQPDILDNRFTIKGKPIFLKREQIGSEETHHAIKTANSIWDCSIVLAKYLEYQDEFKTPEFLNNKSAIELGSGSGLTGIAASMLGANVTVTDVADVLPQLSYNAEINELSEPQFCVRPFDWLIRDLTKVQGPFDYILASDVVWIEELVEPFVRSLEALCTVTTMILFSYQIRSERIDRLLFQLLERTFTWTETVRYTEHHPVFSRENIRVFIIVRRK